MSNTDDKPLLGISLMMGFCLLAPLGDSLAKLLGEVMPVFALLTARFAMQALFLGPLVILGRRRWRMSARATRFTLYRTIFHIGGIGFMFTALRYLPLADAIAIAFIMPFLMLLLGWLVLGEEVGPRRLAACAVGFVGTLMVIQPSFAEVGWPALLPLGVAVFFSLFMLVTRQIAKQVDPIAMQATSGVMAMGLLLPVALVAHLAGWTQLSLVVPPEGSLLLLAGIGLIGSFGHLLMTWSLRYAPSATLAPMQYLEIPFATLIGWLIFRDFPDGLALIGILVTIGAGLYIILRERSMARSLRKSTLPHPPAPPPAV
ncbi:EamA domain-containing membrane protein RarD [Pseudooceanicola antarcticus]|uniref:EamA domain-containing membrane protein RarD n=1 Tax=Pseudooceanicola antarcticus TaxID=1247613 RepID=A0A285IWP2_9RHOB|nr:DMT family transporter [Pseudooceanicola antarcticus]PJE32036.1 EamA/RhaT family transporter [Pseudooceanicola antarcticus]SNY51341.1 EamA domain-containing membrane protein RarD [Pseudooceanicola antarcticus]